MTKASGFIVKYSKLIFFVFLAAAAVCGWLMTTVTVNTDMSKYLPDDSPAKTGVLIIGEEFSPASSFNLMVQGIDTAEKNDLCASLNELPHIADVSCNVEKEEYEGDYYTLFQVTLDVGAYSEEAKTVVDSAQDICADYEIDLNGEAAGNMLARKLPQMVVWALGILLTILFLMCRSWIEPFLFLATIAFAIVINMGTNVIFEHVSATTVSIAAILQLCLSIDYSIMLMNRYRQEKIGSVTKQEAMKKAIRGAFVSISSSSVTTIVGMLALVFMSFTIGKDLGFVLAKGVFFSLVCIFTVLPALILMSDNLIERTSKKALPINMKWIATGNYNARFVIPFLFVALFVGSFFLRGNIDIAYTMSDYYKITQVFTLNNPVVVVYENRDENRIAELAAKWETEDGVTTVNAYSTTLGKRLNVPEMAMATGMDETLVAQMYYTWFDGQGSADERSIPLGDLLAFLQTDIMTDPQYSLLFAAENAGQFQMLLAGIDPATMIQGFTPKEAASLLNLDEAMMNQLYYAYYLSNGETPTGTIPVYDFTKFLANDIVADPLFTPLLTDDMAVQLGTAVQEMDAGVKQLIGENYGRVIVNTDLPEESATMFSLVDELNRDIETLDGTAYVTGSSAIAREMSDSFPSEMYRITILTVVAIFFIVAVAFRSVTIPLVLVCLIQCAVFLTMGVASFQGSAVNYLPLLIVQCLLLGATVDYAILYMSYYREARLTIKAKEAVIHALQNSIHTVLTSGLILVSITGVMGVLMKFSDPAISQILITIAVGGTCAMILVIFVLPGILAATDRWTIQKKEDLVQHKLKTN